MLNAPDSLLKTFLILILFITHLAKSKVIFRIQLLYSRNLWGAFFPPVNILLTLTRFHWVRNLYEKRGEGGGTSLVAQMVKNLPAVRETWAWSPEKRMAHHSSILAWRIPRAVSTMGCKESFMTEQLSLSLKNKTQFSWSHLYLSSVLKDDSAFWPQLITCSQGGFPPFARFSSTTRSRRDGPLSLTPSLGPLYIFHHALRHFMFYYYWSTFFF